jgi:hypothetical protein
MMDKSGKKKKSDAEPSEGVMWQKAIHKFYLGLFNYSPI